MDDRVVTKTRIQGTDTLSGHFDHVRIMLSQHIGAPARPVVAEGDMVVTGQMIGAPSKGLSVGIHASVDGRVRTVTEKYIIIDAVRGKDDTNHE